MSRLIKFASQIDQKTLKQLREYANETDRSISRVLTDAVDQYLALARVRPEFRKATEQVLEENRELLKRLAK